jgi:hypothetical protein
MAPRVSWRTLILMLELLAAVVAWQYFTLARPIQARTLWLAADCHTASTIRVAPAPPAATAAAPDTAREGKQKP